MPALPSSITSDTLPDTLPETMPETMLDAAPGTGSMGEAGEATGPASAPVPRARRRGRSTGPSLPLGSLTQREHRATTECLGCGSTRVTRLSLNLTDGTPVEFTSCHRCEHRSWQHAGDPMSMDIVLDRTRKL